MNYKEILSDKFSNLDEIAKQNQEMYKNRMGIKGDTFMKTSKFKIFIMRFRF